MVLKTYSKLSLLLIIIEFRYFWAILKREKGLYAIAISLIAHRSFFIFRLRLQAGM
jgi:hypothetical protein